jgi:hypothetical protein
MAKIPKEQVVQHLRDKGEPEKAAKAEKELPDQVDEDEHSDLLQRLEVDAKEVKDKIGSIL